MTSRSITTSVRLPSGKSFNLVVLLLTPERLHEAVRIHLSSGRLWRAIESFDAATFFKQVVLTFGPDQRSIVSGTFAINYLQSYGYEYLPRVSASCVVPDCQYMIR